MSTRRTGNDPRTGKAGPVDARRNQDGTISLIRRAPPGKIPPLVTAVARGMRKGLASPPKSARVPIVVPPPPPAPSPVVVTVVPGEDVVVARLRQRGLLELVEEIARAHYLTVDEVIGKARQPHIARARHLVWSRIRRDRGYSFPVIGALFGVDHTTVLAALRKFAPAPAKVA